MLTADLAYDLPDSAIAQRPVEPRDAARLLVDRGPDRPPGHHRVSDLARFVGPGDVVVVNDTRVLPARIDASKATGGAVEVLFLEPHDLDGRWEALVRPSRRVPPGTVVTAGDTTLEIGADLGGGRRVVGAVGDDVAAVLERAGQVPLPPYVHEALDDPERYQTVFALRPSSVAAPTAGLHFTPALLRSVAATGATVVPVDLTVGIGTFRPITAERVEDHEMHREAYVVPEDTWAACLEADRVVAIGTTVVRALESVALTGELVGRSDLFIRDDFDFKVVGALLTNFHVPRSSLLALVDAFVGSRWHRLYGAAAAEGYRFLSFGDAMFLPGPPGRGGAS